MTEAGWTREKPTAHGWYFYKDKDGFIDVVAVRRVDSYGGPNLHEVVITVEKTTAVYQKNLHSKVSDLDGEWLGPITPDSYQQGRVAALDEVERYMAMRLRLAEASLATEILAGNEVKQGRERAAIAELHGMQRHVSDIKEYNAQQAQEGK